MSNKTIIGFLIIAAIITGIVIYSKKKKKSPCACLQGQDAIIDKLTDSELKDQILAMDSKTVVDGKTSADLRNILKDLITKNQ